MNKQNSFCIGLVILVAAALPFLLIPRVSSAQAPTTPAPASSLASLRPRTGTVVKQDENWKWGADNFLLIENNLDQDAVVALTSGGLTVYSVYVRAHESFKLESPWKDVFNLSYASGDDWDVTQSRFTKNNPVSTFKDSLKFERSVIDDLIVFTTWKVQLSRFSGVDANTATSEIGSRPFPKRDPSCHDPMVPADERNDCDP